MSIEAMKQALEALETLNSGDTYKTHNAATALRAAIEQAERQEPVAWMSKTGHGTHFLESLTPEHKALKFGDRQVWTPLYIAPPQREWKGLTDEDIYAMIESNVPPQCDSLFERAAWLSSVVEAKLKEKNT